MNNILWTRGERKLLRRVFHDFPNAYSKNYQYNASLLNYPYRSLKAIKDKAGAMGLSKSKKRKAWKRKDLLILADYIHYPVTKCVNLCKERGINKSFQAIAATYYRIKRGEVQIPVTLKKERTKKVYVKQETTEPFVSLKTQIRQQYNYL